MDSVKIHPGQRLVELLRTIVIRYVLGMSEKKWSSGIDIRTLSGVEWLRLLTGEINMVALIGWCGQCRVGECYQETCSRCGEALILFDEPFWAQIGRKIRRALQKNRTLLSRVKSERESLYGTMHPPMFPAPLAWLHALWEQTSSPPHQPFGPQIHYQVANWVESLQHFGLSKEETIDVLTNNDFPNGQFKRNGKDYGNIPGEDLRRIGEEFRQAVGFIPSSARDQSEMWRTLKWVERQRTTPMARLKGERVRTRSSVGG